MKYRSILISSLCTLSVFSGSLLLAASAQTETPGALTSAQQAFEQKQYAQSRDLLLKITAQSPVPSGTYYLLAQSYLALDQKLQALNAIQQGLQLASSTEEKMKLYLLKSQLATPREEELLKTSSLLLEVDPSSETLATFSALLETAQGEAYLEQLFSQAKAQLQNALQTQNTLLQLQLLKRLDALQPAFDDIAQRRFRFLVEDLWEGYPEAQVVRNYVVKAHLKNQSYEDLLAFYRRELQLFAQEWGASQRSQAFQRIADLHFKLGYLNFATRNYDIAVKQDSENLNALMRQGMADLAQQDLKAAQKAFQTVLQKDPLNSENRYFLALSYFYQGEKAAASKIVQGTVDPPPAYLKDLIELAQISKDVPPRLWETLTAAPDFLQHL